MNGFVKTKRSRVSIWLTFPLTLAIRPCTADGHLPKPTDTSIQGCPWEFDRGAHRIAALARDLIDVALPRDAGAPGSASVSPSPPCEFSVDDRPLASIASLRRQADRDVGFAEPGGDRLVHCRVRPCGCARHLPRLHGKVGINLSQGEIARRLKVVEQVLERAQMRVADGGGGNAIRRCTAGAALLKDDRRSRRRCRGSSRPEAEVVHFGGEALRHAVGGGCCRRI